MKTFLCKIALLSCLTTRLYAAAPIDQSIVVACDFDMINKNADTSEVVGMAIKNPRLTCQVFHGRCWQD